MKTWGGVTLAPFASIIDRCQPEQNNLRSRSARDSLSAVKLPALLLLFFMAQAAIGQNTVPAPEAAGAETYKLRALNASAQALQGKLIKLQFLCRSSIVEHTPDGGVTGEVVDSPSTRIKVDVAVPSQAVKWFMRVPTTYDGGSAFTVYARLSVGKFGQPVALLLGRQVVSDASGSRLEW